MACALAVIIFPATRPLTPVNVHEFDVTVVVPMDVPFLYIVIMVPFVSVLVPEILVLETVIPLLTTGDNVVGFAKLVPEVNEVNEVAGKVEINAFAIAVELLPYNLSLTPL